MNKALRVTKKLLVGVALLGLMVGVIAVGGIVTLFYRAQPTYSGELQLKSLTAPVEIYRDKYGVPHIFASNMNDAARALGYVHASERLFQMEMQRRAGQGRLSEMIGPDMIGVDRFIRTLGLYKLAESSFTAMSPEAQSFFQAYAEGVNGWLATHKDKLPPEFLLLQTTPELWRPADSIVWGKLMALELSQNYHIEIMRAELLQKLSYEKLQWLFPMPPSGAPITIYPGAAQLEKGQLLEDGGTRLASLLGLGHAASNEWVIGGKRTTSGKPILANDPHLDLGAPILWYLARIVTPDGSMKGATVPGLPIVLLGQNDHMAWGFTTTGSDVQDVFIETVDPADHSRYLTPEGSETFLEHSEIIHVKNAPDVIIKVRATRHGPVLSDINAEMGELAGKDKVMALAFTGLGDKDTTSEALMHMDRAKNANEFLEALKLYQTPPQNIVYADDAGTFGYINPGFVPIRKKGDGLMPVEGASGENDWTGIIPLERVPQIINPKEGYIFNANNAIVAADSKDYFGQDWEDPYRAERLQQFFNQVDKFTLTQSALMQADHLSLVAQEFLPRLLTLNPQSDVSKEALNKLRLWDGVMDKDKPEPAIFEAWLYEFNRHMLSDKIGAIMKKRSPFSAMVLSELVGKHAQEWCGDSDCHDLIAKSFDDGVALMTQRQGPDCNRWRWGRENVSMLKHQFYSHIPIFKDLSDLSVESSGDFYTLDRGGSFDNDAEHPFVRTHGGGFRGIYDLANPEASLFMITTGESGHIFSHHYGDLVPLWNDVKSITLTGSQSILQQQGAQELILEP